MCLAFFYLEVTPALFSLVNPRRNAYSYAHSVGPVLHVLQRGHIIVVRTNIVGDHRKQDQNVVGKNREM